jgi:hypothetical protein
VCAARESHQDTSLRTGSWVRNPWTSDPAFASVALYAAFYVGEAKLEATTLYAFVSTLTAVSIVSFGVLLLYMERKYVRTFL